MDRSRGRTGTFAGFHTPGRVVALGPAVPPMRTIHALLGSACFAVCGPYDDNGGCSIRAALALRHNQRSARSTETRGKDSGASGLGGIALRLSPGLAFFLLEAFDPGILPSLVVVLVLAPVGEESLKLLGAIGLEKAWHRVAYGGTPFGSFAAIKLLFPVVAGVAFAILEHVHTYNTEASISFVFRMVTHSAFVCVSWLMCHEFWSRGVRFTAGLWSGLAFGAFIHCVWNYIIIVLQVL